MWLNLVLVLVTISVKNAITADELFRRPQSLIAIPAETTSKINDDLLIIHRVIEAYQRSANLTENRGNSMWQLFFDQRHRKLHNTFMSSNHELKAAILRNPGSTDLFYGFDNLAVSLLPAFAEAAGQQSHATICLDSLMRCAEAIGAIPLDNPESHNYTPPMPWQADAIVDKIRQALGKPIIFPNPYPNEHGVNSPYGIVSYRVPQAIYQAYRIRQLLKNIEHPRVLEIGGGLGRTAYYARILGIRDYTIVDLPFTAISSGYFLGVTLGGDQILYAGEQAADAEDRIKIITPTDFLADKKMYDLIINADGFTEFDPNAAKVYWEKIETSTSIFLSINHEANAYRVKTLLDESSDTVDVERHLYWMRRGYVEEIVRFKGQIQ